MHFESQLDYNLNVLCDELMERTYVPGSSQCFIINDPKKREVFAAEFRDRIVHHLYYNMVHTMLERTFIQDSYSCIKGRGTHYGVRRLEHHIRSASCNYTQPCYVLKLDIKGHFMHIDRCLLLKIVLEDLGRLAVRRFLSDELGLRLHEGKIVLADVCQGVAFLGTYVKPWRRYVEKRTLKRMGRKLSAIGGCEDEPHMLESRLNSYMGVLSHGRSYGALKRMMLYRNDFWHAGDFVRRHRKWCFESV